MQPRLTKTLTIIALWLLARVAMSFLVHPATFSEDTDGYTWDAWNFLEHKSLPLRSPAYAAFLAPLLWLGPLGIFAIQSLLTLATAIFTERRLGFWEALAIAACPFFVVWEWAFRTETLCWSSVFCGWLLIFWRRSRIDLPLGAILLGIAVLTRPVLFFLPLCAAIFAWKLYARRAFIILTAYILVAAAMIPATGPSYSGFNLWIGTWERNPAWMKSFDWQAHRTGEEQITLLDYTQERAFRDAALIRYRTHPGKALMSWIVRYPYLWIGTRTASTPRLSWLTWFAYKSSMWLLNICVIILGFAGGALAFRRGAGEAQLLVPIAYIALIYLPFHDTEPRYSIVAIPFLLALAAYGGKTTSQAMRHANGETALI